MCEEVRDLDSTMDPNTNVSLQDGVALDIVDLQPEHGTRHDARNGFENVTRDSSCGQLLLARVTRRP